MSRYLHIVVSDKAGEYLDRLVTVGLWGDDAEDVASALVLDGLRRAMADGFLPDEIVIEQGDFRIDAGQMTEELVIHRERIAEAVAAAVRTKPETPAPAPFPTRDGKAPCSICDDGRKLIGEFGECKACGREDEIPF